MPREYTTTDIVSYILYVRNSEISMTFDGLKYISIAITTLPDVRKKKCESPCNPTVPGPTESAKTLIKEKRPLMRPNPKPATIKKNSHI